MFDELPNGVGCMSQICCAGCVSVLKFFVIVLQTFKQIKRFLSFLAMLQHLKVQCTKCPELETFFELPSAFRFPSV